VTGYFFFEGESNQASINCSQRGTYSHFVADFDDDTIGSWPAPTAPLHYGPPGASLEITTSDPDTVEVVNSIELGSQGLRLTRGGASPTEVDAVIGEIGGISHTSGVVFIEYKAHGEIVSEQFIAGTAISVRAPDDDWALSMKLFDGSYHLLEGDSYVRMDGSYDPNTMHFVHIELNLDTRKYSICIDDEVVVADKPFLSDDFTNLHSLKFFAPQTVTEAFPAAYVVDEIRLTKS